MPRKAGRSRFLFFITARHQVGDGLGGRPVAGTGAPARAWRGGSFAQQAGSGGLLAGHIPGVPVQKRPDRFGDIFAHLCMQRTDSDDTVRLGRCSRSWTSVAERYRFNALLQFAK
ncbi:UNVERIFIED_CONTAM: hypothetical protein K2H54_056268 [Gekko kuhli]